MASHTVTGLYTPVGVNHSNQYFIDAVLTEALVSPNTLTVQLPSSVPWDVAPLSAVCYSFSTPTYTLDGDIAITTHNITTGQTVLTSSGGGVASGSIVRLAYIGV